jgi:hypothetical protein
MRETSETSETAISRTLERLADLVRCLTPGELFDAERQHIERELRRLAQGARA